MSKKIKITISTKKNEDPVVEGYDNALPLPVPPGEFSRIEPALVYWSKGSECVTFVILGKQFQV